MTPFITLCKYSLFTVSIDYEWKLAVILFTILLPSMMRVSNRHLKQCFLVDVELCFCHDLKEILWVTKFFIIFVKYGTYVSGTGAQFLLMVDSKLH